ncbi:MAG: phosphopantetheine adenylyltransferase [Methanomicrobiaceae archaeon]|nr:phosphopantetheine adenylyltransferase [Methanomicrobiaceae archaeon]
MKVMVGGTFDPLHDGHKKLIERSFSLAGDGGTVIVGLTTDAFAGKKSHAITPYEQRREELVAYIKSSNFSADWIIEPLSDRYGPSLNADFDALVVSEETFPVALDINRKRTERGKKKVDIHQVSCVLAEDGRWISSTRIYRGEIDRHGHLIR